MLIGGGGEGEGRGSLIFGAGGRVGMQKRESPDFRFPEVGISGLFTTTIVHSH